MKKVLVLSAHHAPEHSRINRAAIEALSPLAGVTVHALWQAYPDYQIDVEHEQRLLVEHDHIVLLFPFWWYSSPAILKAWQDEVLTYGFAYGEKGTALFHKKLLVLTSTGGAKEQYQQGGANLYPLQTLLSPFHSMANKTGMIWQTPVAVQGANTITDTLIAEGVEQWRQAVVRLTEDK